MTSRDVGERLHSWSPTSRHSPYLEFEWLVGGPDAHTKDGSLLSGAGLHVRLAPPYYDVTGMLPHNDVDVRKVTLAMNIGGEYVDGESSHAKLASMPIDSLPI